MRMIEISEEAYQTLAKFHGDVSVYVEKLAVEALEIADVQEGIEAYNKGDARPLAEFGEELQERFGITTPKG